MSRHVMRNSLIPIITLFGLDFGALLGGSILIEAIFNLNGVGRYAFESLESLDLPPIMAIVLYGAFFVVLFNTLVDIAYAWLDPRIRLGAEAR
jgi:peptide/nickel transport system permease protein